MFERVRRTTTLALTGFAVAISFAAAPALAQTAPPAPPTNAQNRPGLARLARTPYRPIVRELRGLQLTSEQREQIKGIFKTHQPELKAVAEKTRTARQAWQQSGKIDIQERNSLNEQRMAVLKTVRTEVFNVLTPDQQKQIQARRPRRGKNG